jgi:PAS domain S-box-containing protein
VFANVSELTSARRVTDLIINARKPDYEAENAILVKLTETLAREPDQIWQILVDSALTLCGAHSAGVSLLEGSDQQTRFHWRAIAGRWAQFQGGGTPRDFGPCGTVLDRNEPLLFSHPERDFPYLGDASPAVEDSLLVPFYVDGKPLGTVWVVSHQANKCFDAEDLRIMTNLSKFAAAAYQTFLLARGKEQALEQLQQEAAAAQKFAFIVDSSVDAIISKTLDGTITSWNKGAERIFGYTAEEAIGKHITMLMFPDRYEEEARIIERLKAGERILPFDTVRRRKDGGAVDLSVAISPVRDINGKITGASKIARDISERKLAQEKQNLLLREMRHRVNNLFLVTNALVVLSARSAKTPSEMAKAVQGRLSALTRAHELARPGLIDQTGRSRPRISLHSLIGAIFEPYRGEESSNPERAIVTGCDLDIGEQALTNVALVLHELATNSAKYGALSTGEGTVYLSCSIEADNLQLTWKEVGGPQVEAPTEPEGFGSLLMRQVIVNQFRGKLERSWEKDGLVLTLEIPLPLTV